MINNFNKYVKNTKNLLLYQKINKFFKYIYFLIKYIKIPDPLKNNLLQPNEHCGYLNSSEGLAPLILAAENLENLSLLPLSSTVNKYDRVSVP